MRGSLDIRRLRYFIAIAESGTMSAAARTLHTSQPALSYHMAELERLTGHVLLLRGRSGVSLTEAGRLLRTHARIILDQLELAETQLDALERSRGSPFGRVRLAIISSLSARLIPMLVERVHIEMPDVTLQLMEAGTNDIMARLDRGDVDMAVYLTADPSRSERQLASEQLYFLTLPDEEVKSVGPLRLVDLGWQRLVLPAAGNPLRDFVQAKARQHDVHLDVVLEVDGLNSRLTAVSTGVGGTIVGGQGLSQDDLGSVYAIREIVEPRLFRPIFLGVREDLDPHLQRQLGGMLRACLIELSLDLPAEGGQSSDSVF
jgi:LysR family transcriptional regulator, nitrogen assimilation regulatory protein